MSFRFHIVPFLLLALLLCTALPPAVRASEEPAAPAPTTKRVAKLNPMMVEIRALLDEERRSLASLNERFRATKDADAAIVLEREIGRVKLDTEVAILRAQVKHARLAGRDAIALHLEAAIQELLSPPAGPPAAARPVPTTTSAGNAQR